MTMSVKEFLQEMIRGMKRERGRLRRGVTEATQQIDELEERLARLNERDEEQVDYILHKMTLHRIAREAANHYVTSCGLRFLGQVIHDRSQVQNARDCKRCNKGGDIHGQARHKDGAGSVG